MYYFNKIDTILLTTVVTALFLTSCANTTINTSWRDESLSSEKLGKMLVISLLKNDVMRRKSEDEFVNQLQKKGIAATRSYSLFPTLKEGERSEVIEAIRREGCSTVLVSRPLETKSVIVDNTQTVYTGKWYTHNWYTYYRETYTVSNYSKVDTAKADTAVYDMESEKLLWSAQTETELTASPTGRDIELGVSLILKSLLGN